MTIIADTDRAYAAGLFDGEGCVLIAYPRTGNGRRYHRLDVSIAQIDSRPLRWLRDRYGGHLTANPKRNQSVRIVWHWRVNDRTAEAFLKSILPFSILKSAQIEVALEFRATVRKRTSGHKRSGAGPHAGWESVDPVTADIHVAREDMRMKLQVLKRQVA